MRTNQNWVFRILFLVSASARSEDCSLRSEALLRAAFTSYRDASYVPIAPRSHCKDESASLKDSLCWSERYLVGKFLSDFSWFRHRASGGKGFAGKDGGGGFGISRLCSVEEKYLSWFFCCFGAFKLEENDWQRKDCVRSRLSAGERLAMVFF